MVTTAQLPWHVQNCDMIGSLGLTSEPHVFLQELNCKLIINPLWNVSGWWGGGWGGCGGKTQLTLVISRSFSEPWRSFLSEKRKTWKIYLYPLSFLFNDMVQKELALLREQHDWWRGEIRNQGINSTGVGFTKAPFVIFPVKEFFILYSHQLLSSFFIFERCYTTAEFVVYAVMYDIGPRYFKSRQCNKMRNHFAILHRIRQYIFMLCRIFCMDL